MIKLINEYHDYFVNLPICIIGKNIIEISIKVRE